MLLRSSIKYLHITLQTLVGLCIALGLTATTCFKNLSGEKHYFTFHSWVGITAIVLYVVQYLGGGCLLGLLLLTASGRTIALRMPALCC